MNTKRVRASRLKGFKIESLYLLDYNLFIYSPMFKDKLIMDDNPNADKVIIT